MDKDMTRYMVKEMKEHLVGGAIVGVVVDEEEEFWGFQIRKNKAAGSTNLIVWVLMDAEGNGPGFLDIRPDLEIVGEG